MLSRNRIFLKLGNMTLDKSPSAKAISPQIESTENRTMDHQLEVLHSHGRTNFEDVKQLEGELALSSNSGGSMVRPNKSSIDASEALEAQRADIDRISGIVGRIGRDLKHMKALMESMRTEIHSRPLASTISRQDGTLYPVEELELLTANMTSIGAKAGEVDGLKLELEMMKRRIKRLEDANNATQSTATLAALSQETPRHMQMARTMGPIAGPSRLNGPRPPDRDADIEADQLGNVNMEDGDDDGAGTAKISHGGLDTNHKRPRSSTLETLEDTIPDSQRARPDIENVFRPEAESGASEEEITHLARAPVASSSERPVSKPVDPYFSYHAMVIDNPDDDDYRPGSRSTYAQGTRGSPRGRGGGRDVRQGRGGRLRQSLPSHPFVTPEWEKPEWTDEPRSDGGNDVVTTSHRRSTEVLRRGTGGGSFSEPRQAQRRTTAESEERPVDAEGYLLTSNNQQDSRSTMLPRDERQRDAEGYLLTAKGKRDGRSKFWTDVGAGRVPDPRYQSEPGNTSRHTSIMQQIFPNGVEEGRRRSNLAERLFKPNEVRGGEGGELPKVEGE